MTKRWILLGVLAVFLLVTACIDSETTISVRKDGSGFVTEVVYVNAAVKAMMEGMVSQFGGEDSPEKDMTDPAQYADKAAKMGEGVQFVSAKKVTGKDGAEGMELVYAFEDIRKLHLEPQPDNPMEGELSMGADEEESAEDEDAPIRFDFSGGRKPTLTVYMPQEEQEGEAEEAEDAFEEEDVEDAQSQAGMAMMKPFLQGFRMRIAVNLLDGSIDKTNATHVQKVHGMEGVMLLDVALGEILSNPKYAKDFEKLSQIKKMDQALEKMKDIPGLKIEAQKKVEIRIK